jgi:hypothetical protein
MPMRLSSPCGTAALRRTGEASRRHRDQAERRAVFQATPTGYRRRAGWPEGRRPPPANFAQFSAGLLCFAEIAPRLSVRNLFHFAASLQLA